LAILIMNAKELSAKKLDKIVRAARLTWVVNLLNERFPQEVSA